MTKPVTPQDMFDMWQKMVNPSAYPLQSFMFPMPDAKEIQKKIGELEVVEHWLKANVNMIQLTVKSLQYQLALVKGGEKAAEVLSGNDPAKNDQAKDGDVPNPAAWAWNMMTEASRGRGARPAPSANARAAAAKKKRKPA
jgi:hypothetical protein